ncbi:TonB family protein [Flavihumibacter sp. RY-1]|uniref:TonB family protein n=1 Tax=Flavihumibacter fluminis TaxID=2909236 RepID=A0ABS9BE25_9BACT|nr:energy transducer TonB [Flavihumibacter fluminis]MCF1713303.1 TonB family protein [Flavihumibacter fluminis]
MKSKVFLLLQVVVAMILGVSSPVYSQDTIWFSKIGKEVSIRDSAERYNVVYKDKADTQKVKLVRYLKDGTLLEEMNFYPYSPNRVLEGAFIRYSDGRIVQERSYAKNQLNGPLKTYWENGQLRRHDIYENGKFISGNCYGIDGADTTWFEFEKTASYPGGMDSLRRYLSRNLRYPQLAKVQGIQGTVRVKFTIAKDGSLEDIFVVKPIDPSLDQEAIRLVTKMPKWIPAIQDDRLVKMYFILPIVFRIRE